MESSRSSTWSQPPFPGIIGSQNQISPAPAPAAATGSGSTLTPFPGYRLSQESFIQDDHAARRPRDEREDSTTLLERRFAINDYPEVSGKFWKLNCQNSSISISLEVCENERGMKCPKNLEGKQNWLTGVR